MKTRIVSQGDGIYIAMPAEQAKCDAGMNRKPVASSELESNEQLHSARKLIGASILARDGEDLGAVTDVVLDASHRKVEGYLYSPRSESAERVIEAFMPAPQLECLDAKGNLVCRAAEVHDDAPRAEVSRGTGIKQGTNGHANGDFSAVLRLNDCDSDPSSRETAGHLLSDLPSAEIVNQKGEVLGRILDVMLDVAEGRPSIAILSYGGCGRILAGMAAVPWSALHFEGGGVLVRLDAEVEELCQASIEDYEEVKRAQVRRRIYRQFGQKDPAYWESRRNTGEAAGLLHA